MKHADCKKRFRTSSPTTGKAAKAATRWARAVEQEERGGALELDRGDLGGRGGGVKIVKTIGLVSRNCLTECTCVKLQ